MAFSFGFFNSKNLDRTYTAENFNEYLSSIICNGIQDNYGRAFDLTPKDLKLTIGSGKAWIDGHYFISDSLYTIDLSKYVDASLPRYVSIGICCNTGESFRNIGFEILPGTPATSPIIPMFAEDDYKTYLTICVVRIEADASELNVIDYRSNESYCGYVRCILGKCRVTEMLSSLESIKQLIKNYDDQISTLLYNVEMLQTKVDDITGEHLAVGQVGDNIYYVLYTNGKLVLRGSGKTYDFDLQNTSPFYRNEKITDILVSNEITYIGTRLFYGTGKLNSVKLPDSVSEIAYGAFTQPEEFNHSGLNEITIPKDLTKIGSNAFWGSGVRSVTVPAAVKEVGNYVFNSCHHLESVRIEGPVIGPFMFTDCTSLKTFTITSKLTKFGENALNYCSSLEMINFEGTVEEWKSVDKRSSWDGHGGTSTLQSALTRIQCKNGAFEYDASSKEWKEVK